jgi:CRP/FNR family cyclic AMP-dependent transcriptional regulator
MGLGMTVTALPTAAPHEGVAGRRPRVVTLLDVDPELGSALAPLRFEMARRELRIAVAKLPRGEWSPGSVTSISGPKAGVLLLEGVLARETVLEDIVSSELLGRGDLISPWSADDEPRLLKQQVRWQVLAQAEVVVLGPSFSDALLRFPEINAVLTDRAVARAQRLATMQAISHLNSVERRLCALFWHLAERWGRVTPGGVVVPLSLSHRLLGELVGARRPTVTTALAALERQGSVERRRDGTWLLIGEPPGKPADRTRRVVPHRRRLLEDEPSPAAV